MPADLVLYAVADRVATLTINRPARRNAWTVELADALSGALERSDVDADVRVVVVTGAGTDFSVGADLKGGDLRNPGDDSGVPANRAERCWPHQLSKPVVAALNGNAVGAGITFAMLCDIRIVASDAKVGFVFARRGVVAEMRAHWSLPRVVGSAVAADLLLTGRVLTGAEAAAIGLCHQVVPRVEVVTTALRLAMEMASGTAPVSLAVSKRLLWEDFDDRFEERGAREAALFDWCVVHGEAAEGVASFLERRNPNWRQDPSRDTPRHLLRPGGVREGLRE